MTEVVLLASRFAALWARYLVNWTAWNHARTLASLAAMALLVIGLYLGSRAPAGG